MRERRTLEARGEAAAPWDAGLKRRKPLLPKRYLPLLLMTVPGLLFVVVFSYVPLWGWSMAFTDYKPGVSILETGFAGLKYFARLFGKGSEFPLALRNTLVLSGLNLLTGPLTMLLAVMINEVRSSAFKRTIQTVTSFPNFVSWVVVYSLFFSLLSVEDGILNRGLVAAGLLDQPIDFLGNPKIAWGLQTFITFWKGAGWGAIVYLAAIAGISAELYEAAKIDGAGRLAQIRYITIPSLLPTYFVLLILGIGGILSAGGFDQYFMFHNPLVHDYIEVLDTYAYRIGMQVNDFSMATAAGIFKSVVSILLLFFANRLHKSLMGYSII